MPDPLVDRRRAELGAKLEALPSELEAWQGLSREGGPFEKHSTQIRRVASQVMGLHDEIQDYLGELKNSPGVLAHGRTLELRLLAVHSVWDYFRVKFVLRSHEPFASVLRTADALAWACYEPVQRKHARSKADRREPPLVALQNEWSPTALPRGRAYEVARSPGGWTSTSAFARVIESLPIPILGLPWHALDHLPHVPLLAHEVGHVVENDFSLSEDLRRNLDASLPDGNEKSAWMEWRSEVFADVFACFAAGPAFTWALMDVLASDVDRVTKEKKDIDGGWGVHPTSTLRILLNAEALRRTSFASEADEIVQEWLRTYPSHAMSGFEGDLPRVVDALLDSDVLPPELHFARVRAETSKAFDYLFQSLSLAAPDAPLEPRALLAAAGKLYRARPGASHSRGWQEVRTRIVTGRPPGVLARDGDAGTFDDMKDRNAGRSLAKAFFRDLASE